MKERKPWSSLLSSQDQEFVAELETTSKVIQDKNGVVNKEHLLVVMGQMTKTIYFLHYDGQIWEKVSSISLSEHLEKAKEEVFKDSKIYSKNRRILNLPPELRLASKEAMEEVLTAKPYHALQAIARLLDHSLIPKTRRITAETKMLLVENILSYLYDFMPSVA